MRSPHHWLLPTSRPGSPRQRNGPHQGVRLPAHLWSHPGPSAQVVRVAPNAAQGTAPTHQLQSTLTLLQPRSLLVPRGQPQMARRGLPRCMDPTSMAIPLPCPPNQSDTNRKMSAWRATAHSTLPVSSSTFDGLHSPTGSHTDGTESAFLHHLNSLGSQQSQTVANYICQKQALDGFNLYQSELQPSRISCSRTQQSYSHCPQPSWIPPHVEYLGMFTSRPSSPHLTIDQAHSIFKLAAGCQALGVKLAKEFQVLSGLEAMHCNSIQGTAHKTLTLGHSAWEATYSAILRNGVSEAECEATTHCLHSEADAAWKEMHEVMYNHQLQYSGALGPVS